MNTKEREGAIPAEYNPMINGVVTTLLDVNRLPLYEQAAAETGCTVSVIVREGQPYSFWHSGRRTITPLAGQLAVAIRRGPDQKDHSTFWKALSALKAEQTQPK